MGPAGHVYWKIDEHDIFLKEGKISEMDDGCDKAVVF